MAYEIRPILATFFLYEIPPIPDISSSIPNLSPLTGHDRYIIKLAFPEAVKLFGGLPKDSSGDVYRQFRVNVRRDPNMEINAEAYPNVIDLKMNEGFENKLIFGYHTWKLGVIHEMLHFWNAHTFRYQSGREQWFNEGITDHSTGRTEHTQLQPFYPN